MENTLNKFVESLADMEVTPNVYNQYDYTSKENEIRINNLLIYLKRIYELNPKVLLVGEAPGYRGCRLTGVPFTSEYILMNNMDGMNLFGKEAGYRLVCEKDKLIKEATATIIWETLIKYDISALSWNSFPFHPHKPGISKSNRTPLKKEIALGEKPLLRIIEIFNIEHIVAIGRKSEGSLKNLNISAHCVRHPAQGGKNEFVKGVNMIKNELLNISYTHHNIL